MTDDTEDESTPINVEIGITGLKENSGVIDEEFLRPLIWPNATRVYREMSSNDPIIGAMLFAIEQLIRAADWDITPGGDSTEDEERAGFIKEAMNDMEKPWKEVVSEIMTMVVFGYTLLEPVFKKRLGPNQLDKRFKSRFNDGLWSWRKMPVRAADSIERWSFDDNDDTGNGELLGAWQRPPHGGHERFLPIDRLLHFRLSSRKDNPESQSGLRTSYRPWFFKKRIEEYEAIGIEKDLVGIPIGWVPPTILSKNATADQKALLKRIKDIVTGLKKNEQSGIVFPLVYDDKGNKLYDFKLLESSGSRLIDTDKIIKRYDNRIAQTMLADFILLGSQGTGSFAMSSNKTELFGVAIGAWLDTISDVFNRHGIPKLFELNNWPLDKLPTLTHTDIESRDLLQVADYFSKLIGSQAITPDEGLEKYLRKTGGSPLVVTNEEEM